MNLRRLFVVCVASTLALASMGMAQNEGLTWLAFNKVNSGMMDEAVAFTLEEQDFYDGLMADGTILGWGLATRATHLPGDESNFAHWVVLADWAHVDPWVRGAVAMMRSRSAEETAELEKRYDKIFAPDSHSDIVVNSKSWSGGGGGKTRYMYVGEFFADPDKAAELTALYHEVVEPLASRLLEKGHLNGFGLDTPELHTGDGWTHTTWYALPGLASLDRLHEELAKALTPEVAARAATLHDVARHRDSLWLVLHQGGSSGDSTEE